MLRSWRERAIQTISYEVGGLAIATPLYVAIFGVDVWESAGLMIALSVVVLAWTPIYNAAFDCWDLRLSARVASDRPLVWRTVHAVGLEATTIFVTLPVLIFIGGHGFYEALLLDIGLTLLYTAYGFLFHLAYDRVRPVGMIVNREQKT